MKKFKILLPLAAFFFLFQTGICQTQVKNKDVAIRYFKEVVNNRNLNLLNEIYADSFRVHMLTDSSENVSTISSQKDFLTYLFKAFPDIQYTIGDIIEEGNKVVLRATLTATHKNEFWGHKASGNRINYLSEIFFYRFEKGKIVEVWVQFDLYNLFKKLGGE